MNAHDSLCSFRNRLAPPITDPSYGLALALENCLSSYDFLMSQPIVLGQEASQRFREIVAGPRTPLPESPLPLEAFDA